MEKPELISVHPQNKPIPYKMLNGLSNVWLEFTKKLVGKKTTTVKRQQLRQQLKQQQLKQQRKQQIFRNLVPIFIIEVSALVCQMLFFCKHLSLEVNK